jgi:hypothetical protein
MANVINLSTKEKENFKKFLAKKSGIAQQISNMYVEAAKKDILEGIRNVKNRALFDLEKSNDYAWICRLIVAIFRASDVKGTYESFIKTFIKKEEIGRFYNGFETSLVTVSESFSGQGDISAKIALSFGAAYKGSENDKRLIAKLLGIMLSGGNINDQKEFESILDESKEVAVISAHRGYNTKEIDQAADKLRDYFFEHHMSDILEEFDESLKEEFKDGK